RKSDMSNPEGPAENPDKAEAAEEINEPVTFSDEAVEGAPAAPPRADDVSLDAALKAQDKKSSFVFDEKKKQQVMYGGIGIVVLGLILSLFSCQPPKGSMAYGICSTFLELSTPYPHTLQHTYLEGSRTAVRIYFTS